jgi:hypothetical protein
MKQTRPVRASKVERWADGATGSPKQANSPRRICGKMPRARETSGLNLLRRLFSFLTLFGVLTVEFLK